MEEELCAIQCCGVERQWQALQVLGAESTELEINELESGVL